MTVRPIERKDLSRIVEERAKVPETLRTEILLNTDMQEEWYKSVICNRNSTTRYFIFSDDSDRGYGGIENILWSSGIGEISVLVYEAYRGMGVGRKIVDKILDIGFNTLGLDTLFAECYTSGAYRFWDKIAEEKKAYRTYLPRRKYWKGRLYDSIYYSFHKDDMLTNQLDHGIVV